MRKDRNNPDWANGIVAIIGRLDKSDQRGPVGAGFVVSSDGLIATCAHVVKQSEWPYGQWDVPVEIRFNATGRYANAFVLETCFADDGEDVAFLKLSGELPDGVRPLKLWADEKKSTRHAASFGFPEDHPKGQRGAGETRGIVKDRAGHPRLQFWSEEITTGFSGAPLWDDEWQRVVGMVNQGHKGADSIGRGQGVTFATPAQRLVELCDHDELVLSRPPLPRALWYIPAAVAGILVLAIIILVIWLLSDVEPLIVEGGDRPAFLFADQFTLAGEGDPGADFSLTLLLDDEVVYSETLEINGNWWNRNPNRWSHSSSPLPPGKYDYRIEDYQGGLHQGSVLLGAGPTISPTRTLYDADSVSIEGTGPAGRPMTLTIQGVDIPLNLPSARGEGEAIAPWLSDKLRVDVDTLEPVAVGIRAVDDMGTSRSDQVTLNIARYELLAPLDSQPPGPVSVTGQWAPGAQISVALDAGDTVSDITGDSGIWQVQLELSEEGDYPARIVLFDENGDIVSEKGAIRFTIRCLIGSDTPSGVTILCDNSAILVSRPGEAIKIGVPGWEYVKDISVDENQNVIITCKYSNSLIFGTLATLEETLMNNPCPPDGDPVTAAANSDEGESYAVAASDTVSIVGADGESAASIPLTDTVTTMTFDASGEMLALALAEGDVSVYTAGGEPIFTLASLHEGLIHDLVFGPDGALLAAAGEDGTVSLIDVEDQKEAPGSPLTGHEGGVHALAFSPDGLFLVTAGQDGTARVWPLDSLSQGPTVLAPHDDIVTAAGFNAQASHVYTVSRDGMVRIWDLGQPESPILIDNLGRLHGARFSDDGRFLAVIQRDGSTFVVDLAGNQLAPPTLDEPTSPVLVGPVELTGTGPIGAELALVVFDVPDGDLVAQRAVFVDDSGQFSTTIAIEAAGDYTALASLSDFPALSSEAVRFQTQAPVPPPTLAPRDGYNFIGAVVLEGSGPPGMTIELGRGPAGLDELEMVGQTITGEDGSWTFSDTLDVADTYDYRAQVVAGDAVIAVSEVTPITVHGRPSVDGLAYRREGATKLTGLGEQGSNLRLTFAENDPLRVTVSQDGRWLVESQALGLGLAQVELAVLDGGVAYEAGTWTVDVQACTDGFVQGDVYIVGKCEWLLLIAERLGLDVGALLAVNSQLADPNHILAGQVLALP